MTKAQLNEAGTVEPEVRLISQPRPAGWLKRFGVNRQSPTKSNEIPLDVEEETASQPDVSGKPPWLLISFLVMVVVPSFLALLYFAIFASDQYTAEARFAVRSLADDGANENVDTGIMQMQSASQDAHVVTSFIQSSEILQRLEGKVDYRAMFADSDADFLARFDASDSAEEFLKYWSKHVSAYIDGPSGIVTLTARTFRPSDSVELVTAILEESEKLVNEMTVRAREDLLASFRDEVTRTGRLYQDALSALNDFQQKSGLLSPAVQAQETGKLLTGLLAQKMELESRLFVLQQSSGTDSPSYKQMLLLRESLDKQIEGMQSQLTGANDVSLSSVITAYARFETDRMVAEKLYEASRRNYDLAFAAALRKALYLTVFVPPSMPEEALYPKRISSPFMIFLGLLVLWATLVLIWASVEDHRL